MISATLGLMNASISILNAVNKYDVKTKTNLSQSGVVNNVNLEDALSFTISCGWINLEGKSKTILITEKGKKIIECLSDDETLNVSSFRTMLFDYAIKCRPIWVNRAPYGRKEVQHFMSKDEQRCFEEAELFIDNVDNTVVAWWDNLSSIIRSDRNKQLTISGRKGEWLTMLYEEQRTGQKPYWESLDSNVSGYDIISCVDSENNESIYIEVKSTTDSIDYAKIHLTSNEWENALLINNYVFYLWCLDKGHKMAIISIDEMKKHIPINNGKGEWKETEVPFEAFNYLFKEISIEDKDNFFEKYIDSVSIV